MIAERGRPWPPPDATLQEAVVRYLQFLHTTAVNKVAGLTELQARQAPLPESPAMTPLGLLQHVTAVYRQHLLIHLAGRDLPSLWSSDTTADFTIAARSTVDSVVAAFDAEWRAAEAELRRADWDAEVLAYGRPVRAGRMILDVLQECARHLGHLDIVRELIDGSKGE